jgi:hypothetical protein
VRLGSASHRGHPWSFVTISVCSVLWLASQRVTAPGEPFGLSHCTSAILGFSPQGMKAAKFALISAHLSAPSLATYPGS